MISDFDAIVIGSGISGGWAAKELTEKGLKTLLLDRGRPVQHQQDYPTENKGAFDLPYRGQWPPNEKNKDRFTHNAVVTSPTNYHFFNDDRKNPYINNIDKPFNWIRSDIFGGRSILWGRQCYRWSDIDFSANKKDGYGIDWPIRYKDIAPWYSYVEKFVGVSGEKLNLMQLPDGEFLPAMPLNIAEKHFKKSVAQHFNGRVVTIGRTANLTTALSNQKRSRCMYRSQCDRGCSFGAYFSTQSSTLPAAEKTGNLTIKTNTLVDSLIYDSSGKRITAINVIDTKTKQRYKLSARVIFLCASSIASNQILLNSKSHSMPQGLGNNYDNLGRYLMDHTFGTGATGVLPYFKEFIEYGRRPTAMYVPRFRNIKNQDKNINFSRGYNFQSWGDGRLPPENISGYGAQLKKNLRIPGSWQLPLHAFCEVLPRSKNRMLLDSNKVDRFGIPQVKFEFEWSKNELDMIKDATDQAVKMLKSAGCSHIKTRNTPSAPGTGIHEMGGARMGNDPRESIVNRQNQMHVAENVFITDGSIMTSASCVNPSITYMALTARAVDYAIDQLQANKI